jgi:hypothetical protein
MNFWKQAAHLHAIHGLQDLLIADDIFPISLDRMQDLLNARGPLEAVLPSSLNLRCYAYPTSFDFFDEKFSLRLVEILRELAVRHVFLGVESFDPEVNSRNNKDAFQFEAVQRILGLFKKFNIGASIAVISGLVGESRESMAANLHAMGVLLREFGTKNPEEGGLVRVDISMATPLVGTPWHVRLVNDDRITEAYHAKTGRDLVTDITPDFQALLDVSIPYHSTVTPEAVLQTVRQLTELASAHLAPEMVGGFLRTDK